MLQQEDIEMTIDYNPYNWLNSVFKPSYQIKQKTSVYNTSNILKSLMCVKYLWWKPSRDDNF